MRKPASRATSAEILAAIDDDEGKARTHDDPEMRRLHWRRWAGLHHCYVRSLGREMRESLALAPPAGSQEQNT